MQFLALEEDVNTAAGAFTPALLHAEAQQVWDLHQAGVLRELYFRDDRHAAVLMIECSTLAEAEAALNSLPLVQAGLIHFELIPLRAYPGFARLFTSPAPLTPQETTLEPHMPLPSRPEAMTLLHEWVKSESLRKHMYAVEAALRAYALHFGEDEELWGLTGLLHDLDYERFADMSDTVNGHPRTELRYFAAHDYPPALIHAVEAHATFLGVPRVSLLDKALLACDELTGLITAAAYVRPDRDLRNVQLSSVKKKWKDKAFTAAIDRKENLEFIEELGVPFDEHVQRVLTAMQGIAEELGLAGS